MSRILSPKDLEELLIVVLAGKGRQNDDASSIDGQNKCLLKIPDYGKPSVQYVLDMLYDIGARNIVLKTEFCDGLEKQLSIDLKRVSVWYSNPTNTLIEDLKRMKADFSLVSKAPVLGIFGDHPFVTKASLFDYISKCDLDEADYFPVFVPKEFMDFFKGAPKKQVIALREGYFYHGPYNLILPESIDFDKFQIVRKNRKQRDVSKFFTSLRDLWSLRKIAGVGALLAYSIPYLSGKLYDSGFYSASNMLRKAVSISAAQKYTSRCFSSSGHQINVQAIISPYAEIGIELDFAEDYNKLRDPGVFYGVLEMIMKEHDGFAYLREVSSRFESLVLPVFEQSELAESLSLRQLYSEIKDDVRKARRKLESIGLYTRNQK